MIYRSLWLHLVLALAVSLTGGCALQERATSKFAAVRLIATPASHYSTQKGRYLGEKYRENLNRLVERLVANPKTANLQLANNIASAGGIGFFTHSAVKIPDERFLEVVLDTGDRFDANGDYGAKVARVLSLYGKEVLMILSSDVDMYNEKELAGYGLNFTWRTVGAQSSNERAIIYLSKEKVKAFVKENVSLNGLLADAVIFAVEKEGQVNLVSFHTPEPTPDVRAPIQEQVLLPELPKFRPGSKSPSGKPEVITDEDDNAGRNSTERSGWVSRKGGRATPTEGSSKFENPAVSAPVGAAAVPEKKNRPAVAEEPQPVLAEFGGKSPAHSGQTVFSDGSKEMQDRPKEDDRFTSAPMAKSSQKNESIELGLGRTASNLSVPPRQRGAAEDSQPNLTREFVTPPLTETLSSISKESNSQNNVGNARELASPKETPKSGNSESSETAPFASSMPQQNSVGRPKQEFAFVRNDEIKRVPESKPGPLPKALEGYIIQVAFKDRSEAQRWGDIFQQRGYAVSMTESGTAELLRVRIGNFRIRDDAERELKSLRKNGLTGIILNFPAAYWPEVHSSLP